jgi:hypothetical protein
MTCKLINYDSEYLADQNIEEADISRVNAFCESATAEVERIANRHFLEANYDEVATADLTGSILLAQFPLVRVARVYSTTRQALSIQNTDSTVTNATYYTDSTGLNLSYTASGADATSTLSWESNPTIADLATAINGVGNGWTSGVLDNYDAYATRDLVGDQYGEAKSLNQIRIWAQTGARWMVADKGKALLTGEFGKGDAVRIKYTAGFANAPEDVKKIVAEVVKDMFSGGQSQLQSESLGDYSYSLAQGAVGRLAVTSRDILASYKDRIV